MQDNISVLALKIIEGAETPLETKEIQGLIDNSLKNITRTKIMYRLNMLRGDGLIKGKFVGPGKGVWIWWKITAFIDIKKENKK